MNFNSILAQPNYAAIDVIKNFSQILTEYSQTKDLGICGPKFDNLCHKRVKCRVENDLMKRIADKEHAIPKTEGTYLFDTYINEISKMIDNGCHITIENIEYDSEMSKLGLVDGKADCVKYDMVVSESLSTENRYTDLAVIREGKITAIYQYASIRTYVGAIKILFPDIDNLDDLYHCQWKIDLSQAETAFSQFRKVASNCYGNIAKKSMGMAVAMEIAGIGCKHIGQYVKTIDFANYFVLHTYCPNIKKSSIGWIVDGTKDYNYFIGSGETTATWNLYKQHPYINDKGSAYFHYIFPKYRPLSNVSLPYIRKKENHYGFVSEKGEQIVECKYSFAYPYDCKSNLAAVRDKNNKWGFIDKTGKLIIPHIYDVVNDVFVDGKNFVINDDYLILINKNGVELRRVYGYNYIIPKLHENEIIAYNGIKQQFDVYDFYGNLLLEDCFNSANMSKKEYARFRDYFYFQWAEFTYNKHDDVNEDVFWLPRIPINISSSDITSGEAIDLGIGTLWSSKNLGASSCSDFGKLYLWGDYKCEYSKQKRTRTNGEKFEKKILMQGVPINIGGTTLDIATQTLGKDWRIPNKEELRKLIEECIWEYCILDGRTGYKVVGKNGNSIFLPIEGEFFYESYEVQSKRGVAYVLYWSSELQSSDEPYGLQISQYEYWIRPVNLCYWNYIRPVKKIKSLTNKQKYNIILNP